MSRDTKWGADKMLLMVVAVGEDNLVMCTFTVKNTEHNFVPFNLLSAGGIKAHSIACP
jgi:hypothetical protein